MTKYNFTGYGEIEWKEGAESLVNLRNSFLRSIVRDGQDTLKELYAEAFPFYQQHIAPMNLDIPEFSEAFILRKDENVKQLILVIKGWAARNNLSASWCIESCYWTIRMWSVMGGNPRILYFDPIGTHLELDEVADGVPPPPDALPKYEPLFERRELYLEAIKSMAKKEIENSQILIAGSANRRRDLIMSIYEKAEKYCDSVEDYFLGLKKKQKNGTGDEAIFRRVPDAKNLSRNLEWTVRFQVLGESFSEIAKKEEVDMSTVQRAVEGILKRIGLKKHNKSGPGRPRGSKNKDAGYRKDLGK